MSRKRYESLHVTDCWFNDIEQPESWKPADPFDIDEWIGVTIGDDDGGSNYQIHLCTPVSISRIRDKRGVFMIEEYTGLEDLIEALNRFVAGVEKDSTRDPYHVLATHWQWEYGPINKRDL